MSNESPTDGSTRFAESKKDLANLKQTATDAAADMGDHTDKAKKQLGDLSQHVQDEGGKELQKAKETFAEVVESARTYLGQKPFLFIGLAAAVGFLAGRWQSKD
jgi:ElaB/YqjD/DUF883 family membrane-anchored ribosome-binding protein